MAKKAYRIRNWTDYNEALVNRGSVTFWFSKEALEKWHEKPTGKRGRPRKYSDTAIECALILKAIYKLPFRQTEGFIRDLAKKMQLDIEIPDYTLFCKRQKNLKINLPVKRLRPGEGLNIFVDTTGLKVFGEGEWKVRQHGFIKHRLWRKLHLSINESQEIEAFELTELGVQDCQGFEMLIEKTERPITIATGDGAFDRFLCYEVAAKKNIKLIAPPQYNAVTSDEKKSNKKKASINAVKSRDETIEEVRKIGLKEWKKAIGYHQRSLAETAVFRIKTIFGKDLKSRKMANQIVETAIRCRALNIMTRLGMPKSYPA